MGRTSSLIVNLRFTIREVGISETYSSVGFFVQ